jgi:hypothetical protein
MNSPYSFLALTTFSPSLPTMYGSEVNNQQGEATVGNGILTSRVAASKEELQYREHDREREEAEGGRGI